jgi:hypothetical protein
MSCKDLSRTVIEGGRSHSNIFDRRQSHRTERARVRLWLGKACLDVEDAESSDPRPRPRVGKWFSDKLGPARRWLEHQVGRPWSKVRSELFARFDDRTTAGRHILYDHLLTDVSEREPDSTLAWPRPEFFVDARGILRTTWWHRPTWARLRSGTAAWAAGRRAALGHRGWWWVRIRPEGSPCRDWRCPVSPHPRVERERFHSVRIVPDRAMGHGEVRRLLALPSMLRDQIVLDPRLLVTAS